MSPAETEKFIVQQRGEEERMLGWVRALGLAAAYAGAFGAHELVAIFRDLMGDFDLSNDENPVIRLMLAQKRLRDRHGLAPNQLEISSEQKSEAAA